MSVITARQFEEALRDWGVKVVKHPWWPYETTSGGFDAHGIIHHWTAGDMRKTSVGDQVSLLRHGYRTLPGPLCHGSPDPHGRFHLIGWGNCNHAGSGDSRVYREILAGRFNGSPRAGSGDMDGNPYFYGWEYMFHPDQGRMPDEQVECGALAAAAVCQAHGWDAGPAAGSNLDHFEWSSRKWDREIDDLANRTRDRVRELIIAGPRGSAPTPPPEEEFIVRKEDEDTIRQIVAQEVNQAVEAAIGETLGRMWNREVREDAEPDWRGTFKGTLVTTALESISAREHAQEAVRLLREGK